jgi:hypothetical protein
MYDTGRYFTMTGHVWRNFRVIETRQAELERLHAHLLGRQAPSQRSRASPLVAKSDQELRIAGQAGPGSCTHVENGDE